MSEKTAEVAELPIPTDGPDPAAIEQALRELGPIPQDAPQPAQAAPGTANAQGAGLGGSKPIVGEIRSQGGRPRSDISKNRTKGELLKAARQLDAENADLRAKLAQAQGQPVPAPVDPAEQARQLAAALGMVYDVGFKVIAFYRGKHWQLSDAEREVLGSETAPIVQQYAPELAGAGWLLPVLTLLGVVWVRLETDKQLEANDPTRPAPAAPIAEESLDNG